MIGDVSYSTIQLMIALGTIVILWTGTTIAVMNWLRNQFSSMRKEFHETLKPINELVIRHDEQLKHRNFRPRHVEQR